MIVIDKIAPYKRKRVKGNTQKWFDGEVLEKLNFRNIDKKLYKKSKYDVLKLTASKSSLF